MATKFYEIGSIKIPKEQRFNGVTYYLFKTGFHKRDVLGDARKLRKQGYRARMRTFRSVFAIYAQPKHPRSL